jgi:hypothetical protein
MKYTHDMRRKIFRVFLYGFALVGVIFVGIYFAMQFGWLNVKGSVSERNSYFNFRKNSNSEVVSSRDLNIVC